jgi:imidazolonepropionase-like amidohydrolase
VLAACSSSVRSPGAVGPSRELRYSVLLMGHKAGVAGLRVRGDERDATFEFTDRGRGPKTEARLVLDERGLLRSAELRGNDYFKRRVDERLATVDGKLRWSSEGERGEADAGRALYLARANLPELDAVLVRALLRAPGQALPLLPAGEARLLRSTPLEVEVQGQRVRLVRHEVGGLRFTPVAHWLDADGELFASGDAFQSTVREGAEAILPTLLRHDQQAERERLGALARELAQRPPPQGLLLTNARVFDPESRSASQTSVLIAGERIAAVGPDAKAPDGARVLDLGGRTLTPGLWDMHGHSDPSAGILHVANGVTTARDLGTNLDQARELRAAWQEGSTIGPDLLLAGLVDGRGPLQDPTELFADSEDEGRAVVDRVVAAGYVQLKIYSSIKKEVVPGLVAYAHQKGLRVSGHVPDSMLAEDAVRAGFDELQHMIFIALNFLATRQDDTRGLLKAKRVAEKAASLDPDSGPVRAFIALLRDRHVVVDTTLAISERTFTARPGEIDKGVASASRLPVLVQRDLGSGGLPADGPAQQELHRRSHEMLLRLAKRLHESGVALVAGTDLMPGFTLHRELELWVRAGIPAPEVLRMATLGAAQVMKRDGEVGTIAPGKLANLAVFDGRPDERIEDVERVSTVIKRGVIYSVDALERAVGVRPR